jgi:hypothetical protein
LSDLHTPDDEEVRSFYAAYAEEVWRSWNPGQPLPQEAWAAPFDRWLQRHDEAVRQQ